MTELDETFERTKKEEEDSATSLDIERLRLKFERDRMIFEDKDWVKGER